MLPNRMGSLRARCAAGRAKWRASGLGRMECLLLLAPLTGLLLASAGFFVGRPCGAWPMAAGFAAALAGALGVSWRRAAAFVGTVALLLAATALTFSYTGTDAINYHFPMQRLLAEGWNPIFDSSVERFRALAGEGCALWHTLFLPKTTALCGALMARLTGLFAADAFLGYALMVALWRVGARFARTQWACGAVAGHVFAAALALSTKITSFLAGQVDYTAYAAFLASLLAFLTWRRANHLPGDLFVAVACLLLAMTTKTTGLVCGVLACGIAAALEGRRRAELRWGLVALGVSVAVLGASPLLTAWVRYGAPVYPAMTFDPTVSPVDITADFTGNADALSMGYLARIVYAWVSPALAVRACALWSGRADFAPVFEVAGGVGGLGAFFRLMLLGAAVALACARRNAVTWLCLFLFVTANLAPLKYIGYARYFPQIWAIPFLAAFNLAYAPRPFWARLRGFAAARAAIVAGVAALTAPVAARTVAYQGRMWALERERQARCAEMAARGAAWRLEGKGDSYTLRRRLAAAGLRLTAAEGAPAFRLDARLQLPLRPGEDAVATDKRFPICDRVGALARFPWGEAFRRPPRPLRLP